MREIKCFIGGKEKNDNGNSDGMGEKTERVKLLIKKYLELNNVSVLTGAGTSFHLGAPVIQTIPQKIHEALMATEKVKDEYKKQLDELGGEFTTTPLETFINYLQASRFIFGIRGEDTSNIDGLISAAQEKLFKLCNTEQIPLNQEYESDDHLKENKYFYHEKFVKKILQRPVNLRRINLFTTNYDLAFEYAFDNTGVQYINGFSGFSRRSFHPETYDYDIYYPGQTTSGTVHRAERVIRYYKLHGSLSWIAKEPGPGNYYGIEEIPVGREKPPHELIIYPCVTKKTFTLDLPYSELFRLFSSAIKQDQSVLFCLGYSFNDEHINDIIYQSLSIPSFTLFIIDYRGTENPEIRRLRDLDDPRIIIIEGEGAKFTNFVSDILPDLCEEDDDIKIAETMNMLSQKGECSEKEDIDV
ncbi:conserved hypothetical protein [uncultured spirochete]|jgi:hypothetical protein|uniref:Uncharacterized protein n=1 Tax=uncultured spirochete TaxID=156406 RepID=A0A3P3XQI0_9SPIR|nr:conserved hypothetical protein [uncultured spirochete]